MAADAIDREALDNLLETVGGDQEFLDELIDSFLDDSPQQLAAMQQALSAGNAEELRRAAHSLKSNSANFGAQTLSQMCKELEEIGRNGALDSAAGRVEQILAEYQRVKRALEEIKP
jgi:HPt (histidine-containing phosphotransfer) domain-containing protein